MRSKKKILIAGGSHSDIPMIVAAKNLGCYVITSGNKPEELGHAYSDEYHKSDYSDNESMLFLSQQLDIDGICACSNDFSALSSAYVAEKLNLPGHDSYQTSQIIHHKDLYRNLSLNHKFSAPKFSSFDNIKDGLKSIGNLDFPLMIKPVDLTGGKGITKINTIDEAAPALEKAFFLSKSRRVIIEEFIVGSHHSLSVFLRDRQVVFSFSADEYYHYSAIPYMVSAASTPSVVPLDVEKTLVSESERIASLLMLKDGVFHIQYILKDNNPIITEICRRSPGDLYTKLVEYATGVDYASWIVKSSIGLDCSELVNAKPQGFFNRHCIMSSNVGEVNNIIFDNTIKQNIIDKFMCNSPSDNIRNEPISKLGIIFLKFSSMDELLDNSKKMNELIQVRTC